MKGVAAEAAGLAGADGHPGQCGIPNAGFTPLTLTLEWLESVADADMDEIVADGGVTAAVVIQQEARTVVAPRLRRFLASEATGSVSAEVETSSPAIPAARWQTECGTSASLLNLSERATQGEWEVYSEPDVGLPPSIFTIIGMSGAFPVRHPVEPLNGYDLTFIVACVNYVRELLHPRDRDAMQARKAGGFEPRRGRSTFTGERDG